MEHYILEITYLIASVLFIFGLKMLGDPRTARRGNLLAALGMGLAILATMIFHKDESGHRIGNYAWIIGGLLVGTVAGWLSAKKVKMTAMPQMVSIFNGMGGACAALISISEYNHLMSLSSAGGHAASAGILFTMVAGLVIGSVSFTGSVVAFAKLQGIMRKNIRLPFYNIINILVLLGIVVFSFLIIRQTPADPYTYFYGVLVLSLLYGVLFVIPIGGADMPVVISLLNSFTGVAAAFGGFLYDNQVMLTGGILVGSAGTLLTIVMCRAMNRSLLSVVFGSFGSGAQAAEGSGKEGGNIKATSVSDVAILLNYARKVIVVPGYGLAVAQAQHAIHEMESILEEKGVEVKYAIHPVAGRMPGHMNVLLAEANVDYEKLSEMEEVNPEFPTTDVVLVVGANDVVNPAAKNDPSSSIYGMPVLNVEEARNVIVIKRSMNPGYAGIENELFGYDNCSMLFADAKAGITQIVTELKNL